MSPLHAGTGQSIGAIDLPIARERPTGIPLLPGSSLKGALRALSTDVQMTRDVFGPDTANSSEHAGSVQFSDCHLLLLPVRSVAGTFAWVTSRYLLQRFARTAREAGIQMPDLPEPPAGEIRCVVVGDALTMTVGGKTRVILEDLDFEPNVEAAEGESASALRHFASRIREALFPIGSRDYDEWRKTFLHHVCLVHDNVMALLLETATEITARIRLGNETKTVAQGALWYEESLPTESVLAGLVVASDVKAGNGRSSRTATELFKHVTSLTDQLVQLGGKSTVGRGSCLIRISGGPS
jgi:CRISPR-associated protein Cmr4